MQPTWLNHPIYVDTFGPQVCDVAASAGFAPYPEQELLMDLLFAIGPDGKSVAFENVWIAPRQVMKTGAILIAEIGWLFVTKEKLIVHSAHELSTTEEAFNDLAAIIERTPALSRRLKPTRGERPGIFEGNGRWAIHTHDSRVRYKARTKSGGRGLTGWKVVLDEGFAVQPKQLGALLPTLTSVPDPQFILASSACLEESDVLRDARDRGRAGTDPTQAYAEWGDKAAWTGCKDPDCTHAKNATGCVADDEERWANIIPGLGERIQVNTIRSFRRSMPPAEFLREFMVWHDDPATDGSGPTAIDTGVWGGLKDAEAPGLTQACVVLDTEPDRSVTSIGVAGINGNGDRMVLEHTSAGDGEWVVDRLKALRKHIKVLEIALHPDGQARTLIPALQRAEIEWEKLTTGDYAAGCSTLITKVAAGDVIQVGQPELDAAVAVARTKFSGEKQLWSAEGAVPLAPLRSISTALHRFELLSSAPDDSPPPDIF